MAKDDYDTMVVVRGSKSGLDPNYACLSHDEESGHYGLLRMKNGELKDREVYSHRERKDLETVVRDAAYRGVEVHADDRDEKNLLSFDAPKTAKALDFAVFRRAKSDDEGRELADLANAAFQNLHKGKNEQSTRSSFRGVSSNEQWKSGLQVTKTKGFIQYRGGFKSPSGLVSDLTRVEPRNQEWKERLARAYRGLHAVSQKIKAGATLDDLNRTLTSHLNRDKDVVYGDTLHHTGYEGHERYRGSSLQPYDFVTVGCAIGDGNDTALVYTSSMNVSADAVADAVAEEEKTTTTFRGNEIEETKEKHDNVLIPSVFRGIHTQWGGVGEYTLSRLGVEGFDHRLEWLQSNRPDTYTIDPLNLTSQEVVAFQSAAAKDVE